LGGASGAAAGPIEGRQLAADSRYPNLPFDSYAPDGQLHFIDKNYPGLQCIHADPRIFVVHDFLSAEECDGLIASVAGIKMTNAYVSGGSQNLDYRRCQTRSVFKQNPEFPRFTAFREKVRKFAQVAEEQLEVTNLTRYTGDENFFKVHGDAVRSSFSPAAPAMAQLSDWWARWLWLNAAVRHRLGAESGVYD
jgi:hypothetical protein